MLSVRIFYRGIILIDEMRMDELDGQGGFTHAATPYHYQLQISISNPSTISGSPVQTLYSCRNWRDLVICDITGRLLFSRID